MRLKPGSLVLVVSLFLLCLNATGCTSNENASSSNLLQTPSSTVQVAVAPASAPTLTVTAPPTPAPAPTETRTPRVDTVSATKTPAPTATPTNPAPTMTLAPTLTAEEDHEFYSELMSWDDACPFPCWWNIIPGETTVEEAQARFPTIDARRWLRDFDDTYVEVWLGPKDGTGFAHPEQLSLGLYYQQGVVTSLQVTSYRYAYAQTDPTLFEAYWAPYGILQIIDRFGAPSQVHLFNSPVPGALPDELILTYENHQFQVSYNAFYQEVGEEAREVCFGLEELESIYLATYGDEIPPDEYNILTVRGEYEVATWEQETGTTVEDFYDLFKDSADGCLSIEY